MIAVDSSTIIAYLNGLKGKDTDSLYEAIRKNAAALCPLVITEVTSAGIDERTREALAEFHLLEFSPSFWFRAGTLRHSILNHGLKARLADAVIAQSAIDANIPLLTRDRDFRHYATLCGLELA
jgi:predicted nucleic acid-binding protein